jgi:hypothetical protein
METGLLIIAQTDVTTYTEGAAWLAVFTAAGSFLVTIGGLAGSLMSRYYKEGTEAKIRLTQAETKRLEMQARADAVNAPKIIESYEQAIRELRDEYLVKIASLQSHIDIIDKKLDAAENRERECIERAARLEGRLSVLERNSH